MKNRTLSLVFCLAIPFAAVACGTSDSEPEPLVVEPGKFVSAERCGSCHKDIYAAWQGSLHARAYEDKIFQVSYNEAIALDREEAERICMTCHAPTTLVTGDIKGEHKVTREGVTCDFCHSLAGTDLSRPDPFELRVGQAKLGPVRDAESHAHEVEFSPFHTTSLHCAGCHEFTNRNGLEILKTFSEWELYKEKGGQKSCQECHMPVVAANIVDPKVKRVQGGFANLHEMPGGHSLHQLNKSLRLRITNLDRTPQGLMARIKVTNVGAGHHVPTGIPTRKIVLRVTATTDDKVFEKERVFTRVILDKDGKELSSDSQVFINGNSAVTDTRIAPLEERIEEFLFPIPMEGNVQIQASLTYLYSPHDSPDTEIRIEFWKESKQLLTQWSGR
jgi:hypothetical protein